MNGTAFAYVPWFFRSRGPRCTCQVTAKHSPDAGLAELFRVASEITEADIDRTGCPRHGQDAA